MNRRESTPNANEPGQDYVQEITNILQIHVVMNLKVKVTTLEHDMDETK